MCQAAQRGGRGSLLFLPGFAVCWLSACATPTVSQHSPAPRDASAYATGRSFGGGGGSWPSSNWWTTYDDPQLGRLIEAALQNSPDLGVAIARLHRAEGLAQIAGAALLPSVDGAAAVAETRQSYNDGTPVQYVTQGWQPQAQVQLNLTWNLDLWGRNRAALAAATSDELAAQLDLAEARLLLSTNIGSAYASLAQLYTERDVEESALHIREETRRLVAQRVELGLDSRAELREADSAVPAARADLADTEGQLGAARNRIAALIGLGPDAAFTITRPTIVGHAAAALPEKLAIDLLGRRPDIAVARARVEAAAGRVAVARADFFPNLSLSALVGLQAIGLGNLFQGTSLAGSVGPALSLPIFHGGQLNGQYHAAQGDYEEAVAQYDATVIQALHEVADVIVNRRMHDIRLTHARNALTAAEDANSLSRTRYAGGMSTYLNVLSAEDRVLQSRRLVADLEVRAFTLDVALVRALGGGAE
jgi:NodT family efflux transporter outer membrane factor (OMF) lipoprotein